MWYFSKVKSLSSLTVIFFIALAVGNRVKNGVLRRCWEGAFHPKLHPKLRLYQKYLHFYIYDLKVKLGEFTINLQFLMKHYETKLDMRLILFTWKFFVSSLPLFISNKSLQIVIWYNRRDRVCEVYLWISTISIIFF